MPEAAATAGLAALCLVRLSAALVVCLGAGSLWPRADARRFGRALAALLGVVSGMGWVGLAMLALGMVGAWNSALLAVLAGALFVRGARELVRTVRRDLPPAPQAVKSAVPEMPRWLTGALLAASAVVAVTVTLGALAPDAQQDSLWYHLSCARAWIEWGRPLAWPTVYPSNYTLHGSMLYSALLRVGDEVDCSLLYAAQGFACYALAALFAARWFGRGAGVWAWFLCATGHGTLVWFVPINTGSDLTVAMFATAAMLLLLDGFRPGFADTRANLLLSALLTGFAASTKVTALGYTVLPWLAIVAWGGFRGRVSPRHAVSAVALALAPFALWALRSLVFGSGNPVFPMLRGLIPVRPGFEQAVINLGAYGGGAENDVYLPVIREIVMAARDFPQKVQFAMMTRTPVPLLHAALVAGLFLRRWPWRWFGALALAQWTVFFLTSGHNETVKYFAVCFPAALVGVSGALLWFWRAVPVSTGIRGAALAGLAVLMAYPYAARQAEWGAAESVDWRYRPVLTSRARADYLRTKPFGLDRVDEFAAAEKILPPDAVVLFAEQPYPFYLRRRFLWSDSGNEIPGMLEKRGLATAGQIREWLRGQGVTHVFTSGGGLENRPGWREILRKVPLLSYRIRLYEVRY